MAINNIVSKLLISADGTQIYADAKGDPARQALVFIHGFSLSSIVWDSIFDDSDWTNKFYLVRYDTRGHGRSGKPEGEAAWESKRLADDFDAVVNGFKLHKPFVAAWSLGGTNITDILAFHPPSYIAGVIFIAAVPFQRSMPTVPSPAGLGVLGPFLQTTDVTAFQTAATTFAELLSDSLPYPLKQTCLGDIMAQPRAVTMRLIARKQDEDGLIRAGKESLPALSVYARNDGVIQGEESVKAVKEMGWKVTVVELETGEHMPWVGDSEAFKKQVVGWIGGVLAGKT